MPPNGKILCQNVLKNANRFFFQALDAQLCLLFNISIEANSVDPDQTALGEQSDLDLHCLFKRLHNISIDDKNIRLCCNIRFKG